MDLSIIITAYNYEKYIEECLESCLQQTTNYSFEVIVIDDGSTDSTQDILNLYKENLRIKILSINNSGIEKASNIGFFTSQGEYVVRLDADDKLLPNFVEHLLTSAKKQPDFDFYYADYCIIDENGSRLEYIKLPDFSLDEVIKRGDFLATGTVIRRQILMSFGGYNESTINSGLENYEFILELINKGSIGLHINEGLFLYRRHKENISEIKKEKIISYGKKLFKEKNYGSFSTNKYHPYKLKIN